jgi:hypothetical protein
MRREGEDDAQNMTLAGVAGGMRISRPLPARRITPKSTKAHSCTSMDSAPLISITHNIN